MCYCLVRYPAYRGILWQMFLSFSQWIKHSWSSALVCYRIIYGRMLMKVYEQFCISDNASQPVIVRSYHEITLGELVEK